MKSSTKLFLVSLIALAALVAGCARRGPLPGDTTETDASPWGSPPPAPAAGPPGAIESRLFLPDLIMDHQAAIGMQPTEREAIMKEAERGQAEMMRLQWDLQASKEQLALALDGARVDEPKAMAAASRVLAIEDKVKSSHLQMLIRVKNLLTPEQQTRLQEIKATGR